MLLLLCDGPLILRLLGLTSGETFLVSRGVLGLPVLTRFDSLLVGDGRHDWIYRGLLVVDGGLGQLLGLDTMESRKAQC